MEYPSALSYYDKSSGLDGTVTSIVEHNNTLYIASDNGLFFNDDTPDVSNNKFQKIRGIDKKCYSLLSTKNSLLAACADGVYSVKRGSATQLTDFHAKVLYRHKKEPRVVFTGLRDGLAYFILKDNGEWGYEGKIEGVKTEVNSCEEDTSGNLWLGTPEGTIRVEFHNFFQQKNADIDIASLRHFDEASGLNPGACGVFLLQNKPVFQIEIGGCFYFNDSTNHFAKTSHTKHFSLQGYYLQSNKAGNYYYIDAKHNDYFFIIDKQGDTLPQAGGKLSWPKKIRRHGPSTAFYFAKDSSLWFGYSDGRLFHFDNKKAGDNPLPFSVLVHKVYAGRDSLIFGGSYPSEQCNPRLSYHLNNLIFEFSAMAFGKQKSNRYRYFLDGFDKDWSGYEQETVKEYTNLPPGSYTFRVKAENIDRSESEEGVFHFTILPPWYRTWWAYLIYAVISGGAIYWLIRWRANKISAKRQAHYERQQKREMQRLQMIELRLSSLRAQMNPHFTFNAMTSIQNLVLQKNYDGAQKALTRFSRLVRQTLDHSDQGSISIGEEIDFLKNYLEVENLRFQSKFKASIDIDPAIDQDFSFIPPMIVQPYLENAIKHGLLHKKSGGILKIVFKLNGSILNCTVEDNGVGRQESRRLSSTKSSVVSTHKSKGMSITKKRLELLNAERENPIEVKITDLQDDQSKSAGTRVELEIPIEVED
jgi:hypothetical protein